MDCNWSKEFLEAGNMQLNGYIQRQATLMMLWTLKKKTMNLKSKLLNEYLKPNQSSFAPSPQLLLLFLFHRPVRIDL